MKGNALNKYDAVLTPDERFRLALAAMARNDEAEVRRLHVTCPRYSYTMADTAFSDRFAGSWEAAMRFGMAWLWSQKQYVEALWLLSMHRRAAEEGLAGPTIDAIIEMIYKRGGELKATYAGLVRFCEAARLDWRVLLQWWPPLVDEIEGVREAVLDNDAFETPDEVADVVYRLLAGKWPAPLAGGGEGGVT